MLIGEERTAEAVSTWSTAVNILTFTVLVILVNFLHFTVLSVLVTILIIINILIMFIPTIRGQK